MEFDSFTVGLLIRRDDAPAIGEDEAERLQDAHLAHLSAQHAAGLLLAAGPAIGPDDQKLRGFLFYAVDAERARELAEQDPAVRAGRLRVDLYRWMVPAGVVSFKAARLPGSMAEAEG